MGFSYLLWASWESDSVYIALKAGQIISVAAPFA